MLNLRVTSLLFGKRCLSLRRTPGFLPLDVWRQQRDRKFDVEKLVFPMSSSKSSQFFNALGNVNLSGKPIDSGKNFVVPSLYSQVDPADRKIINNLSIMKIDNMSPIQQYTASILSENELIDEDELTRLGKYDFLGSSQTGSGKTLAYLFPLMNNLLLNYPVSAMKSLEDKNFQIQFPSILVLAPTRELAQQIFGVSSQLSYRTFLRSVCLYGGEKPFRQTMEVNKGVHLAICTPGRLLQFLDERQLSLKHCRHLVIDEADRMLDMGFEPQLREIIENPKYEMPSKSNKKSHLRQTAMFSATFPNTVMKIAKDFLRGDKCISVSVSYENQETLVPKWGQNMSKEQLSNLSRIPKEVTQKVVTYNSQNNYENYSKYSFGSFIEKLISENKETIGDDGQILVFTNTRNESDAIDRILFKKNYISSSLHGNKSQMIRNQIIDKFRKGTIKVLVATSVAARGLDFPNVKMVINAGIPTNEDDYVHRVGRTGRFGSKGIALTVFNPYAKPEPSPSVAKAIVKLISDREGENGEIPKEFIKFSMQQDNTLSDNMRYKKKYSSFSFQKSNFRQRNRSY